MKDKRIIKYGLGVVILGIIIGLFFIFGNKENTPTDTSVWAPPKENEGENGDAESLGLNNNIPVQTLNAENSKLFEHTQLRFSFRFPSDMTLSTLPNLVEGVPAGEVILVQNSNAGRGFQITISPFDEPGNILTKERIQADVPDLKIIDPKPLLIGESGQGLAFLSDNDQFGGNSREVWFVFNGNLYQISTYAHLDPILQSVFATWTFK